MYRVSRTDEEVEVIDNAGKTIYKASLDSFIIYQESNVSGVTVGKVKDLKDGELLAALATSIKLSS